MAVLAHPDDESLGFGGTLAKYASEGVETFLVTATRGEGGRYRGHGPGDEHHPGSEELGKIRVGDAEVVGRIADHLRRVRPDVVVTFGPDGAYGHPDHIAISQFTTAAIVKAADPASAASPGCRPHVVSKLYYLAWPESTWDAYQQALKKLTTKVDGVERQAVPWPDWAITTAIDTRVFWPAVWRAVSCHESQVGGYERLAQLRPEHQEALWGRQWFYRVFSTVNGGRTRESDLLEGLGSSRDLS